MKITSSFQSEHLQGYEFTLIIITLIITNLTLQQGSLSSSFYRLDVENAHQSFLPLFSGYSGYNQIPIAQE